MGDGADMAIDNGLDGMYQDLDDQVPEHDRVGPVRCSYCGETGLFWDYTELEEYTLNDYYGKLHLCRPHSKQLFLSVNLTIERRPAKVGEFFCESDKEGYSFHEMTALHNPALIRNVIVSVD